MNKNLGRDSSDGFISNFIMGQLAAAIFAVPTAAILWFLANRHLAFWGSPDAFIGSKGFWFILLSFAGVSLIFPKLFPSLLGKVWHGLIRFEQRF